MPRVTYCSLTSCWLAHNQFSRNVLFFFCNPIGQICLGGPGYSSRTATSLPSSILNFIRLLRVVIAPSVTTLLRGEKDSKQSDEIQLNLLVDSLLNFGPFLSKILGYKQAFSLGDTPQNVGKIDRAIYSAYSCWLKIQLFRLRITINAIFFFSSLRNKQPGCCAWKRLGSMV